MIPVFYGPSPVLVLSLGICMRNLVDLLMVKIVALLFRNWLLLKMPMPYGVVVGVWDK